MRRIFIALIALSLTLSFSFVYPALKSEALAKAEDDFELVKVADGVYAAIAKPDGLASGNAGVVVGDDGVVIVDTFFAPAAIEELISEIGKVTQQPLKHA